LFQAGASHTLPYLVAVLTLLVVGVLVPKIKKQD
jgi:hypothetical protein